VREFAKKLADHTITTPTSDDSFPTQHGHAMKALAIAWAWRMAASEI
jgi:hypothetical protein